MMINKFLEQLNEMGIHKSYVHNFGIIHNSNDETLDYMPYSYTLSGWMDYFYVYIQVIKCTTKDFKLSHVFNSGECIGAFKSLK